MLDNTLVNIEKTEKEAYLLAEMSVVYFENTDIICESSRYELPIIPANHSTM